MLPTPHRRSRSSSAGSGRCPTPLFGLGRPGLGGRRAPGRALVPRRRRRRRRRPPRSSSSAWALNALFEPPFEPLFEKLLPPKPVALPPFEPPPWAGIERSR